MPHHVVVDGSNLATEGRSNPSLKQLNEAVIAYMAEHPTALITVVVDATFGHRIDPREVAEFDAAIANNELVAPPAGAVGRGDAFVLSIANKVNATILSNDSYQEFHGQYPWLFDEGRLVGGKPVPHVGWVFVERLPVRGPTSRKSVAESKRRAGRGTDRAAAVVTGSPEASKPMPVPSAPPPGARPPKGAGAAPKPAKAPASAAAPPSALPEPAEAVNDLASFLTFVEHHPPGTSVNAVVESYSSHGAYVTMGEPGSGQVRGYVPLRLMSDPPPRSAREVMRVGESVTLVVEVLHAARRSIDLALPTMATAKFVEPAKKAPARAKKQPDSQPQTAAQPTGPSEPAATTVPAKKAPAKKAKAKEAPAKTTQPKAAPAKKAAAKKAAPAKKSVAKAAEQPAAPAPRARKQQAAEAVSDAAPAVAPRRRRATSD